VQPHQQHDGDEGADGHDQAPPAAALEQAHPAAAHGHHDRGEQVAVQGDPLGRGTAAEVAEGEDDAEEHPDQRAEQRSGQQDQISAQVAQGVVEREQACEAADYRDHDAEHRHTSWTLLAGARTRRPARPYDRGMPTISLTADSPRDVTADVLILPLVAGADDAPSTVPGSPEISEVIAALDASASHGELHRLPAAGLAVARTLLLVGVGEENLAEVSEEDLRLAFGAATRSLAGVDHAALALPTGTAAQRAAALEGGALGAYAFTAHKSDVGGSAPKGALGALTLVTDGEDAEAALERATVLADIAQITRDLVNTPPNLLYPAEFARRAEELVAELPLTVSVLDEKQLAEGGYGGIVGVGQGSTRPPRLVKLEYAPEGAEKSVALVGKGITFDTGGISLKPAAGMDDMTSDMAGAATVLAATIGAARLGLGVKVTTYLALAENMPGGGAQRPGDVVTMRNGK